MKTIQTLLLVATLCCAALFAHADDQQRIKELKHVINRHTGFAHFTRGMNEHTIAALRGAVTEADIPVLEIMLRDTDNVTAMTSAATLQRMGNPGMAALRRASKAGGLNASLDLDLQEPQQQDQTQRSGQYTSASQREIREIDEQIERLRDHSRRAPSDPQLLSRIRYGNPVLEITTSNPLSPAEMQRLKITNEFRKSLGQHMHGGLDYQFIAVFAIKNATNLPLSSVNFHTVLRSRADQAIWEDREIVYQFEDTSNTQQTQTVDPEATLPEYVSIMPGEVKNVRILIKQFNEYSWKKMPHDPKAYQLQMKTTSVSGEQGALLAKDKAAIEQLMVRRSKIR